MRRGCQTVLSNTPDSVEWKVLERDEILRKDPWFAVHCEQVRLPNGRIVPDYHQIEMPHTTVSLVIDDAGRLMTLRQYKHAK